MTPSSWNRDTFKRFIAAAVSLLLVLAGNALDVVGDLRSPAWYLPDGTGTVSTWHYRVPVSIPGGADVNSTVRLDVDFNALLTLMGVSGDFDSNAVRIVRSNGVLAATQQFTDRVYEDATDNTDNGRGEVRFLLEDAGPVEYYLYFDILQNGSKSAWDPNATINGNFEFSNDGQQDPPGWDGRNWQNYQAQAIADDWGRTVVTQGGSWLLPMLPSDTVTTDEVARSGGFCYLLGARDQDEQGNPNTSARLQRTIVVPASNPGVLRVRYRIKGWSSSSDGSGNHDFIRMLIVGAGPDSHFVGPVYGNYTDRPYSPNLGQYWATTTRSGYRQYNGWDTDTGGNHRSGMSVAPGTEPWFEAVYPLAGYAGQTVTLRIESHNRPDMKTWFHIDDVEWSVVTGVLGTPQGFGLNIVTPNDTASTAATIHGNGDTLTIRVVLDGAPTASAQAVSARLYDPFGTTVASNILLFNDGSHGDLVAADNIWTNDGSVPAQPTYTFTTSDPSGTGWMAVVWARDGSISSMGAPDGLIHIPGRPVAPVSQENYFNADGQSFTLSTPASLVLVKSVLAASDPVNGIANPKAVPGAFMGYTIEATNEGGGPTDSDSVTVVDAVPQGTALFVGDLGPAGSGPVVFEDGVVPSGLAYTYVSLADPTDDIDFSNNDGASWSYTPVPDSVGVDDEVTHIRIRPKGLFLGAGGGNIPSFVLRFQVRVQ